MAHNPYSAPRAELNEAPRQRVLAEKPAQIRLAVALLWLSVLLGIPILYLEYQRTPDATAGVAFVVLSVVLLSLAAMLNVCIARGRNWARIVYLLLFVVSTLLFIDSLSGGIAEPVPELALNAFSVLIDAAAMYFLFTSPGALWFKLRA